MYWNLEKRKIDVRIDLTTQRVEFGKVIIDVDNACIYALYGSHPKHLHPSSWPLDDYFLPYIYNIYNIKTVKLITKWQTHLQVNSTHTFWQLHIRALIAQKSLGINALYRDFLLYIYIRIYVYIIYNVFLIFKYLVLLSN